MWDNPPKKNALVWRINFMNKKEELLKQKWVERVAEFRASGQTTTECCVANNIKAAQLRYWLRKYRAQEGTQNSTNSSQWLPLEIDGKNDPGAALVVKVGRVTIVVKPGFDKKEGFELDPFSSCLFVFCNRKRDKLKILHWEVNGFWKLYGVTFVFRALDSCA